jgi:hypothetical protein
LQRFACGLSQLIWLYVLELLHHTLVMNCEDICEGLIRFEPSFLV